MTESVVPPRKTGSGIVRIKHGSAVVPIYSGVVHGQLRYTVAFHLNGQRIRRTFGSLQKAKLEAQNRAFSGCPEVFPLEFAVFGRGMALPARSEAF